MRALRILQPARPISQRRRAVVRLRQQMDSRRTAPCDRRAARAAGPDDRARSSRTDRRRRSVRGVLCAGAERYFARRVVLATGTFLGGKTFAGESCRTKEVRRSAAAGLAVALRRLGFPASGSRPARRPHRHALDRPRSHARATPARRRCSSPIAARRASRDAMRVSHRTNDRTHALCATNSRSPLYGLI